MQYEIYAAGIWPLPSVLQINAILLMIGEKDLSEYGMF